MALLRAPDGTEFTDRAEYRKYLFLTQYTFKDRWVGSRTFPSPLPPLRGAATAVYTSLVVCPWPFLFRFDRKIFVSARLCPCP